MLEIHTLLFVKNNIDLLETIGFFSVIFTGLCIAFLVVSFFHYEITRKQQFALLITSIVFVAVDFIIFNAMDLM